MGSISDRTEARSVNEESTGFQAKLRFLEEPRPTPIFANHIRALGVNEYVFVRFYSTSFPPAVDEDAPLPHIDARLVSEVVVPQTIWTELIDGIIKKRTPEEGSTGGE